MQIEHNYARVRFIADFQTVVRIIRTADYFEIALASKPVNQPIKRNMMVFDNNYANRVRHCGPW